MKPDDNKKIRQAICRLFVDNEISVVSFDVAYNAISELQ